MYETIPLQFRNVEYEMHCVKVLDKNDIKKIYLEKDVGGGKVSIFAHSNPEISIFSSGRIMGDDLYAGFEINETYYNLGKFYMDVYDERIKAEENWASEIDFCGIKLLRICGAMGLDYYHTNYYSFHDGKPGTFLITSGRGIERDIDNDGKEEIISSSGGSTSSTFIYKYEKGCIKECHLNPVLDNAIAVFYDENTNNFLAYYPDGKFKSKRFKYNGEEMLLLDMEYRPGQFQNYLERVKERLLLKKKE
ncbi:MAG TPA: hypothetical protein PLA01_02625 [Acetivibrio sp.]|nr:hypothetical protein [Acetivibrio sp.]